MYPIIFNLRIRSAVTAFILLLIASFPERAKSVEDDAKFVGVSDSTKLEGASQPAIPPSAPPFPPTESESRLTDKNIPLQEIPSRPGPLLEIGQHFLGTGTIDQGIRMPGGAVWQPYFMVFGTLRSGLQSFQPTDQRVSEWANRLDLFANLYFTFTERIVFGVRPLDREGRFTSYLFQPSNTPRPFNDRDINGAITTLFFEGDFGELFPDLDTYDRHGLDYGFSVGRQNISFQEGMLINDNVDAVGITKINWKIFSAINFRWTLLFGWNQINRTSPGNFLDNDAKLFGLFTEADYRSSTVAFDIIYVDSKDGAGKGIYAGLSSFQRWGAMNTSFRIMGSAPVGGIRGANDRGLLFLSELSWTPRGTENFIYFNQFAGIGRFRSAARDPSAGGPLAPRAGVLFAGVGLGGYGSALSNAADDVIGGALGYQMFFHETRQQLLFELGARYSKEVTDQRAVAVDATYQIAAGRRFIFRFDAYAAYILGFTVNNVTTDGKTRTGGRFEIVVQF